jgi:putative hydrolase of the HAD superfamily
MDLPVKINSYFVFDLDDTLYPELDYLQSAFRFIASEIGPFSGTNLYDEMLRRYHLKENVFEWLVSACGAINRPITMPYLLDLYRNHDPEIRLDEQTAKFLSKLKQKGISAGLITDGRSITQRNKLKALGLSDYFKDIIISEEFGSEKPDKRNYLFFENKYPGHEFFVIGDNTATDFLVPEELGWTTICLRSAGRNIHPQDFSAVGKRTIISTLGELILIQC